MSNLIKSSHYIPLNEKKKIHFQKLETLQSELNATNVSDDVQDELEERWARMRAERLAKVEALKEQMISDAERQINELRQQVEQQCDQLKKNTEQEIASWWEQKRNEDESIVKEARENGYEEGYQAGLEQAENDVMNRYKEMLDRAQSIVEQSYLAKEKIISEAEPFLLELSIEIARKIIGKQYSVSSEWVKDTIKNVLSRRKEHGIITLCVSPSQFEMVMDAKEELMMMLDSQAELQIVPDQRVDDYGCIVRSSYGSIDARIDTQLEELKKVLLQAVGDGIPTEGSDDYATG